MSSCAICLEPEMNSPAACVPCGHTFCLACITQWTRSPPRFGLSLCPQCRAPVREVQKLFITDWPVSGTSSGGVGVGGGPPALTQLSAWQQFHQLMILLVHFASIPAHSLARYGPELARQLTVWLNQQADRLVALRATLIRCAATCGREWRDLGLQGQCLVGAAVLLVGLLLVQDLQAADGIHRGVVLPVLLLLLHMLHQLLFAAAYLLWRPLACLLACGLEVGVAGLDVAGVVAWAVLCVLWDALCVPWLLLCLAARLLGWGLGVLAGLVRLVMFLLLLALSLGLPALLATAPGPRNNDNNHPHHHLQLPEVLHAGVEWLRQAALRLTQQAAHPQPDNAPPPQQQPAPHPPRVGHFNILREFMRLLSEELRNVGQEEGEEGEERRRRRRNPGEDGVEEVGEEAPAQDGGDVQQVDGGGGGGGGQGQGLSLSASSSLHGRETLEVW
ncbi:uncharacterized protein LOC143277516 [Babylonia areolata]|uniref:uncharacterized protein LOC143277516 n=1 Tax=Babylonia areolata TaxID=304850 RepID=UPI003FD4EEEA